MSVGLNVERLSKTFVDKRGRSVTAIEDVAITAAPGEFVSIVGPSGCGKSTLLLEHLGYVATKDFYFLPERGAPNVDAIQHAWDWMHELGAVDTRYQVEDYLQPDLLP